MLTEHIFSFSAYEAYFPLSTVHLTIPQNDDAIEIFKTTPIVQFSAESLRSLDLLKEVCKLQ